MMLICQVYYAVPKEPPAGDATPQTQSLPFCSLACDNARPRLISHLESGLDNLAEQLPAIPQVCLRGP